MDGNTDIQKMASNFAGLTQARLSSGGDIKIPLAQELQYAKFYIELQQMRFGNKISYQVSVSDEALLSCLVPKLTLEMLVENAVGHGIEPKEGPGTVRVSVGCTENGSLELVVTDDGVGILPDKTADPAAARPACRRKPPQQSRAEHGLSDAQAPVRP